MSVALIQSSTEVLPGWWALLLYLVPAGVALGLVIALLLRRRCRREKDEADGDRE